MLPRKYKLTLNNDFEKTFKTGRSMYGRFFGFKFRKNLLKYSRFGVILGLKIDKSSVNRHRLKRQIYSIVENNCSRLSIPMDYVIIALPAIKEAKFVELETEITDFFTRISKK